LIAANSCDRHNPDPLFQNNHGIKPRRHAVRSLTHHSQTIARRSQDYECSFL
jgi:hypothetical protein